MFCPQTFVSFGQIWTYHVAILRSESEGLSKCLDCSRACLTVRFAPKAPTLKTPKPPAVKSVLCISLIQGHRVLNEMKILILGAIAVKAFGSLMFVFASSLGASLLEHGWKEGTRLGVDNQLRSLCFLNVLLNSFNLQSHNQLRRHLPPASRCRFLPPPSSTYKSSSFSSAAAAPYIFRFRPSLSSRVASSGGLSPVFRGRDGISSTTTRRRFCPSLWWFASISPANEATRAAFWFQPTPVALLVSLEQLRPTPRTRSDSGGWGSAAGRRSAPVTKLHG
ncbi:D111/G-patch domain-containing protein [Striga asiatica]|uniref:D111/G-patch domain-containing protein n=1 Tax=Striga asiatica TaxID=4170 RepID=A0A5A7QC25_STRAF|nr:D111/G-patch domain-containing protein [Striga asiatica]